MGTIRNNGATNDNGYIYVEIGDIEDNTEAQIREMTIAMNGTFCCCIGIIIIFLIISMVLLIYGLLSSMYSALQDIAGVSQGGHRRVYIGITYDIQNFRNRISIHQNKVRHAIRE